MNIFSSLMLRPQSCHGLLVHEVSRSQNDAPQSVGLLGTSDRLVAEASYLTTHNNHNPSKRAVPDLNLRPRNQWDRPLEVSKKLKCEGIII